MNVTSLEQPAVETVDLVAKEETDRKPRLPVEQIDRVRARLDRGDLVPARAPCVDIRGDVIAPHPRHLFLRAKRRLGNFLMGWMPGDPGQHEPINADPISRPKERANVVEAPDIVEHDDKGERPDGIVLRGQRGRDVRKSFYQFHQYSGQSSRPMNTFAVIVLVAIIGEYALGVVSGILSLRAFSPTLPAEFAGVFDAEKYAQARRYTETRTRFGFIHRTLDVALLVIFWFVGGFEWLDQSMRSLGHGPIVTGLLYIGTLALASTVLGLPFRLYSTFVIEARFGFNRTTGRTFTGDLLKGLLLGVVLGGLLLAVVLGFFEWAGPLAWLWCWIASTAFTLAIQFIAPTWIMPLFNTFTPLDSGELHDAIVEYARTARFPLQGIFVVDGSRRSSKANAFFTGFGKHKRIGLFDTLVEHYSVAELVAVVAHEVGHYKKRHVWQAMARSIAHLGAMLWVLSLFLQQEGLFAAFYVSEPSVYAGLLFFGLLFTPVELALSVLVNVFSRKNEFEADEFSAATTGNGEPLIRALKKLSADNLSNLTPHPFEVFLHYSHPPVLDRIRALRALG